MSVLPSGQVTAAVGASSDEPAASPSRSAASMTKTSLIPGRLAPSATGAVRRAAKSGMGPGLGQGGAPQHAARERTMFASLASAMEESSSRPTTAPVYCDLPDVSWGDMGGMPEDLDNDGVLRVVREVDWAADPSPYHLEA